MVKNAKRSFLKNLEAIVSPAFIDSDGAIDKFQASVDCIFFGHNYK